MKKLIIALNMLVLAFHSGSASAQRFDLPWGGEVNLNPDTLLRVILNPSSFVNPTGVPSQGDFMQAVLANPDQLLELTQRPQSAAYLPVASAMISGRNAVLANGGHRIPDSVRQALSPFYSAELLDSVRWSTNWNAVQNTLQTAQMFANRDTQAITLVNAVVFRDANAADDVTIWAHELFHVQQYKQWGVLGFAERWTNNSSDSGPVEGPAYEQQNLIRTALFSRNISTRQPVQTSADCTSPNASTAFCDLFVANASGPVQFKVSAIAHATSDGTRSGSMRLVMLTDARACNLGADRVFGVDNATQVEGDGFSCFITVMPGKSQRVFVVAPNNRADARFTRASATWTTGPFTR